MTKNTQPSKTDEIETITNFALAQDARSYLGYFLRPAMLEWLVERIKADHDTDIFSEFTNAHKTIAEQAAAITNLAQTRDALLLERNTLAMERDQLQPAFEKVSAELKAERETVSTQENYIAHLESAINEQASQIGTLSMLVADLTEKKGLLAAELQQVKAHAYDLIAIMKEMTD